MTNNARALRSVKPISGLNLGRLHENHYQFWVVEIDPGETPIEWVFRPEPDPAA